MCLHCLDGLFNAFDGLHAIITKRVQNMSYYEDPHNRMPTIIFSTLIFACLLLCGAYDY